MIESIEVVGVENFADSAVTLRSRIKTKPAEQWKVGREYRRRLKKAFDAQGIEIPFPSRTLLMGEPSTQGRGDCWVGADKSLEGLSAEGVYK